MRTIPLLAFCFLVQWQDSSAQDRRTYLYRDLAPVGANVAYGTIESKFSPVNKVYADLSASERAVLNAMYEEVKDGDEPPFPLEGLRPVFRRLMPMLIGSRISGRAALLVDVDSAGKVTALRIGKGSTPEISKFLSQVVTDTRFKPAVCSGKPCAMAFPLEITVELPYAN
jgi:hypothetical protein